MGWLTDPWVWAIAGLVLAGAELLLPGFYLIVLGPAALATAAVAAVAAPGPLLLVGFFGALSLAACRVMRGLYGHRVVGGRPVNVGPDRLVGETAEVAEPIVHGRGKIRVGDSVWLARGADLPAGARVRVVAMDGTCAIIEPDRAS